MIGHTARMLRRRGSFGRALLLVPGGALLVFLALPPLSLLLSTDVSQLFAALSHPLVGPALRLSAFTTLVSLALVVLLGTPLAWLLAQARSKPVRALETLAQLPIVMPPAVAGIALLFAFGRRGLLSGVVYPRGQSVAFTTLAVIMAETFVSAPFFVQAALSAFRRIDPGLLLVARSLGASPLRIFVRVAVPLALPGLAGGAALSWARSLGEFGATLMFAGNLAGKTQTLPLAIYTALESDLPAAQALSVLLMGFAFVLLVVMRAALRRSGAES